MNLVITPYSPLEIPKEKDIVLPDKAFYHAIGKDTFKKMIEEFYDKVMESDIAFMFPQEDEKIDKLKEHNGKFFIEIAGGPNQYSKKMGSFDQIEFHKQFNIGDDDRVVWLSIWKETLQKYATDVDPMLVESYFHYLDEYSKLLIKK